MTDAEQKSVFAKQLNNLRSEYLQSLPDKLRALQSCSQQLEQEQSNLAALHALIREAHMLTGSAGCYGFSKIGAEARTLEQLMTHSLSQNDTGREQVRVKIRNQLSKLIHAMNHPEGAWEST